MFPAAMHRLEGERQLSGGRARPGDLIGLALVPGVVAPMPLGM